MGAERTESVARRSDAHRPVPPARTQRTPGARAPRSVAQRATSVVPVLGIALATAALGACGDPSVAGGWTAAVDTLPGGAVEVSNPAEGLWDVGAGDEASRWALVEDLRLGAVEGASPELFGRVADIEVDDVGRIYVLDADAAEVRAFGPDGAHLRTFGRRGEGPGELSRPQSLAWGPEDGLWVVDMGNHRYSVFDTGGALVDEKRRFADGQVAPWPGTVLDDGRVVEVSLQGGRMTYTVHDPRGTILDTVALPAFEASRFVHTTESSRVSVGVPYAPYLFLVFDPRGHLWTGVSDDYRIVQRSLEGGDSLRIVRRAYDPVPVTDLERTVALENLDWFRDQGGRVDASRLPEHHRAFTRFHVDRRGYLWVEPVTPRQGATIREELSRPRTTVFDVFDVGGRYLGRLEAGMALRFVRITASHVYGVTVDEVGVQHVVRLRIEGRGGG